MDITPIPQLTVCPSELCVWLGNSQYVVFGARKKNVFHHKQLSLLNAAIIIHTSVILMKISCDGNLQDDAGTILVDLGAFRNTVC